MRWWKRWGTRGEWKNFLPFNELRYFLQLCLLLHLQCPASNSVPSKAVLTGVENQPKLDGQLNRNRGVMPVNVSALLATISLSDSNQLAFMPFRWTIISIKCHDRCCTTAKTQCRRQNIRKVMSPSTRVSLTFYLNPHYEKWNWMEKEVLGMNTKTTHYQCRERSRRIWSAVARADNANELWATSEGQKCGMEQ